MSDGWVDVDTSGDLGVLVEVNIDRLLERRTLGRAANTPDRILGCGVRTAVDNFP